MPTFEPGDRVRLDITDTTDTDFNWHGQHGQVVEVLEGDAGEVTGDDRGTVKFQPLAARGRASMVYHLKISRVCNARSPRTLF